MQIKQKPSDFIVEELYPEIRLLSKGEFAYCILEKENYTLQRLVFA